METGFIRKIYRQKDIENISQKLKCLGKDTKFTPLTFCNTRFLSTIFIFVIVLLTTNLGYLYAPFVAIGYYYLFYYLNITKKLNQRNQRLEHQALYFFEILTLTLESGRNLENALTVTCDNVNSEMSDEFKQSLAEMQFGKSLIEALNDMTKRISSDTINNIILNIIQTSQFGNSILDSLYNEVDFLRAKEILKVKGQINKIPNKVSIISVLFIVPLILVLILGPYLIKFIG
jgi:tight adherence protein C